MNPKQAIADSFGIELDDENKKLISLEQSANGQYLLPETYSLNSENNEISEYAGDPVNEILGPPPEELPHAQEDYEFTRKTMKDIVEKANQALDDVLEVAQEDATPRAYEVVGKLLETAANITKEFYDIQKKFKDLSQAQLGITGKTNFNIEKGAVFVGDSAAMLKRLKDKQAQKKQLEEQEAKKANENVSKPIDGV